MTDIILPSLFGLARLTAWDEVKSIAVSDTNVNTWTFTAVPTGKILVLTSMYAVEEAGTLERVGMEVVNTSSSVVNYLKRAATPGRRQSVDWQGAVGVIEGYKPRIGYRFTAQPGTINVAAAGFLFDYFEDA